MSAYTLHVKLKSDTTFGSGHGVPGLVNHEVEYDPETGLPEISGNTLKGLLIEECANIFYALQVAKNKNLDELQKIAKFLFGVPGSSEKDSGAIHIGTAQLPDDLYDVVRYEITHNHLQTSDILKSLTTIRTQTKCDRYGTPVDGSLRSYRAVLRSDEHSFVALLSFDKMPSPEELAFLDACARGVRRGGLRRNRGTGYLDVTLHNEKGAYSGKDDFNALIGN